MLSNRCFYDNLGDMNNVAYVMFNTFRINYNIAIQEGMKLKGEGSKFECFIYHIEDNKYQNDFFEKGISNYDKIESITIHKIDSIHELSASLSLFDTIFFDQPYLKEEKEFVSKMEEVCKNMVFVEHIVSVPVRVVSDKEEYNARTIRSKLWKHFPDYHFNSPTLGERFIFEEKAHDEFEKFVSKKLRFYDERNDPSTDFQSHMSKYLKYGFISVNEMYEILETSNQISKDSFLEELIVRRELAYNFVFYNEEYDDFNSMTYEWAYQTMKNHSEDPREYIYNLDDYINFKTHDKYFNAAMKEMILTNHMHGYMRMYWAKKILEWSPTYEEAYNTILYLNNAYFLDGNTPNGYMNVAWIFGKHDRAWAERPVFGKLRYMNENGLRRKFNIDMYVNRMEGLDVSKT